MHAMSARSARSAAAGALALTMVCGALAHASPLDPVPHVRTSSVGQTPRALALTISGGVSLGAYEAGFLYFIKETLALHPEAMRARLFTGASAGSANAIIAAIESCSGPNPDPEGDLGWRMWIPVGFADLFKEDEVSPVSVFRTQPMERAMEQIWEVWRSGLPKDCDVVIGVSATRVERFEVRVGADFHVPRVEERFGFRIQGQGLGVPIKVTNYVDPDVHYEQPLLNFVDAADDPAANRHNFEQVQRVLFASGAFPFAFPPVRVPHCLLAPRKPGEPLDASRLSCPTPERSDLFIDGGVFDNTPLRWSNTLSELGLRRSGEGAYWRDLSAPPGDDPVEPSLLLSIDPSRLSYPDARSDRQAGPAVRTFFDLFEQLVGDFVVTARAKELYALVQESQSLSERIQLSTGNYPKASDDLYAFMGFFERDFRYFDFFLGMYDAWVQVGRLGATEGSAFADVMETFGPRLEAEWAPLACLIGWFEPTEQRWRSACAGPDQANLRILIQSSLDKVHEHCRKLEPKHVRESTRHPRCIAAAEGAPRVDVTDVPRVSAQVRQRAADEDGFDQTMRLLTAYGFEFKDLGLRRDQARYGRVRIRRRMLKMADRLAAAQPSGTGQSILYAAGRQLANTIAYEPPKHWVYVTFGTALELGASVLPVDWNESWARLNLGLGFKDLPSLLGSADPRARFTLALGPEFELLFMTDATLQPQIGARVGYQFATRDRFGFDECTAARALDDSRNCSQFTVQSYFALGVAEVFRAQLLLEFFPQSFALGHDIFDLQLMVGVQYF